MTIKVHKKGVDSFRVKCPNCGCDFSYQQSDVTPFMFMGPHIQCPTCGQRLQHVGVGRHD